MKRYIFLSILIAVAGITVSCGGGEQLQSSYPGEDAALQKAKRATDKLMGTLMGEVKKSMQEDGPAGAVRHCADRAMELTDEVSEAEGVRMRRVTDKPRNNLAVPDAYEKKMLARFASAMESGTLQPVSEVVELDGRPVLRYVRPLTMKEPCLTCHGDDAQIAGNVREVLAERYPGDRATGYHAGELRGAISVIVPLEDGD